MNAYADTSFLCSVYMQDANSAAANKRMQSQLFPLPWTELHELELKNAFRCRVFRKEITRTAKDASLKALQVDLAEEILEWESTVWSSVWRESMQLSLLHTEAIGNRTLDILHVATALVLGKTEFLTFDARQAALAKIAGLRVIKL